MKLRSSDTPLVLSGRAPFDEAAAAFRRGGVIAFPTETFYGLGVDPFNISALEKLFALKGREQGKPVALIIGDASMLASVASDVPQEAFVLMDTFWPGPLTMLFRANMKIPGTVTGKTGKVGVRVSSSSVCQRFLKAINSPITATSANPAGMKPAKSREEVIAYFGAKVDVVIDGGRLKASAPSTVIDMEGKDITLVRQGAVPFKEIMKALGRAFTD